MHLIWTIDLLKATPPAEGSYGIYLLLLQQIIPLAYHLLSPWENRAGRAGQLWTGPHPRLPLSQRPAQRQLYVSVVRGALRLVPMLERPQHIVVLKALKVWKENELLPEQAYGTCNGIFLYVCQAFAIFLNS